MTDFGSRLSGATGRRPAFAATVLAVCLASCCASAADLAGPPQGRVRRMPVPVVRVPSRGALVPNCFEGPPPRILNCPPQVEVAGSPAVAAALDAPPAYIRNPYPTMYAWPFGANAR